MPAIDQRKLPLNRPWRPYWKTRYIQRLERELLIARMALADERERRLKAEKQLASSRGF